MVEPSDQWQQRDLLGLLGTPIAPEPIAPEPITPEPIAPAAEPAPATARDADPMPAPPTPAMPASAEPAAAQPTPLGAVAAPRTLLVLDTETTGLNPAQGQCIEVGAILFAVAERAVLSQVSFLLPCEHNPAQPINGIAAEVTRLNQPWQAGLACFAAMVASCDAVLAHNAAFDRQWFTGDGPLPTIGRPWICSMEDIHWPAERQLRPTPSVRDLALAYGVPVWAAHRALTDCIYLAQVLERCEQLEDLLQAALEPRQLFRAKLGYSERHQAKQAGFRWNDPVPGAWTRRLSLREARALPFAVQAVEAMTDSDAA
jgi:DNA polymerase-3 subunit epsilon